MIQAFRTKGLWVAGESPAPAWPTPVPSASRCQLRTPRITKGWASLSPSSFVVLHRFISCHCAKSTTNIHQQPPTATNNYSPQPELPTAEMGRGVLLRATVIVVLINGISIIGASPECFTSLVYSKKICNALCQLNCRLACEIA